MHVLGVQVFALTQPQQPELVLQLLLLLLQRLVQLLPAYLQPPTLTHPVSLP